MSEMKFKTAVNSSIFHSLALYYVLILINWRINLFVLPIFHPQVMIVHFLYINFEFPYNGAINYSLGETLYIFC